MGQTFSRLCSGQNSHSRSGARPGGWKRFETNGAGDLAGRESPGSCDVVFIQPPHSPAVSSVSMLANYDDDEPELDAVTEESSWETVQLEDDDDDTKDKDETSTFKYSSIKTKTDKKPAKKRKRHGKGAQVTPNASTSEQKQAPLQSRRDILAGNGSSTKSSFRPGNLPAVIAESKPMKDADRLLGALSEHACADGSPDEGQEAGDAVRRIIQHDIGRERTVNVRLRELKDIEGRKSERRLSVTAVATMSLNVIPEIIGEEPADPGEYKYSDTDLYF